jgi:DNA-directed RNA polymerase II subunit RPB9
VEEEKVVKFCIFMKENKQFCRECNNMLYPKEDKQEKMLYLACRNCEHFEEATNPIVYFTKYKSEGGRSTLSSVARDIANDPTLRRVRRECKECGGAVHVLFQTRDKQEDSALTMTYVCCKCFRFSH